MDDAIRHRLAKALDAMGLDHREVSTQSGLNELYLYEVLNRQKGSLERVEKIAKAMGLRWGWVKDGEGEMLASAPVAPPLERANILAAIEAVLEHYVDADRSDIRDLASTIVGVAVDPPGGRSGNDMQGRIRTGIAGALLLFETRLRRQNKG